MDNRIVVSALAISIVASRLLHNRLRTTTLRKLSKGQSDIAFAKSFELPGQLDALVKASQSTESVWKFKPHILQHESKGKIRIFETISPWRKSRRYYAITQKGPNLQVAGVPATSDLVNLLTMALLIVAIGIFAQTGWPFVVAMCAGLATDLVFRIRFSEGSARQELSGLLSR
jgi:hypothetical protein